MAISLHKTCLWTSFSPSSSPHEVSSSSKRSAFKCQASMNRTGTGFVDALNCGRREILLGVGSFAVTYLSFTNGDALAAKAPSGYQAVLDKYDKYQFLYPFGWQEVSVKGQDCVYKDVIEPLESVSVNIIETNKADIKDFGTADEVAKILVGKVLTSSAQESQVVGAKERVTEGKTYYTFEFISKAANYTRHALSTVTVSDGKFYTLTTGANERRWTKMQDKLRIVADSFAILT